MNIPKYYRNLPEERKKLLVKAKCYIPLLDLADAVELFVGAEERDKIVYQEDIAEKTYEIMRKLREFRERNPLTLTKTEERDYSLLYRHFLVQYNLMPEEITSLRKVVNRVV